jgi:hypothetical protein
MSEFEISSIVDQLGTTVYIVSVSKAYSTDYGDATSTRTEYQSKAVVQVVDGSEEMVNEGLVQIGDIICFFDEAADNIAYLKNENEIKYGSSYYRIYNTITNDGHYEIQARKY